MKQWIAVAAAFFLAVGFCVPASFSQDDSSRKIVSRAEPQYPRLARTMRISGSVKVEVLVAPNGTVKSLEVTGGHPLLAQSAQNAIRLWKWEAAAHETHESIELRFKP